MFRFTNKELLTSIHNYAVHNIIMHCMDEVLPMDLQIT